MELVLRLPPGENMMKNTMTAAAMSFVVLSNSAMAAGKANDPEVGWFFEILRQIFAAFAG